MRRILASIAAIGGALALLLDVWARPPRAVWARPPRARSAAEGGSAHTEIARLAKAVAHEDDHVTAGELAQWIRDRKPGLRVIDLRTPAEFGQYHLPGAENIPLEAITATPFLRSETVVLISAGGAHAAQAWVFLQLLGHRNVFFLRGGLQEWTDALADPKIGRYFGGPRRSGGC